MRALCPSCPSARSCGMARRRAFHSVAKGASGGNGGPSAYGTVSCQGSDMAISFRPESTTGVPPPLRDSGRLQCTGPVRTEGFMAAEHDPKTPFETILEPDAPDAAGRPAGEPGIDAFVQQIKETAEKLTRDRAARGDAKLLATALKELRYCFKVFAAYRGRRKVTIFGSARTKPDHPAYQAAVAFSRRMAEEGYMVITGAASGIMEAGHVGAGRENSFGVNIILPFEQGANSVISADHKLKN